MILPPTMRQIMMPLASMELPVAGRPLPAPVFVPRATQYTVTRSPSAMTFSGVITRSGKACFQARAASWSSLSPTLR